MIHISIALIATMCLHLALAAISNASDSLTDVSRNPRKTTTYAGSRPVYIDPKVRLCLDALPDGVAIVENDSGQEILMIFKVDLFWWRPVEDVVASIENNKNNMNGNEQVIFAPQNQLNLAQYWPGLNMRPNYVVSFTGLNKSDSFYNNVLVFVDSQLFRYKVLEFKSSALNFTGINIQLINQHIINYWFFFPQYNDLNSFTILRGTRVALVTRARHVFRFTSIYILNIKNLDNPIEMNPDQFEYPGIDGADRSVIKFQYQVRSGKSLWFEKTGKICVDRQCNLFRQTIICDPSTKAFINSFAYWLWKDTNLTLRLLMVSLTSIMVVNFTLALSFIYNQIKRIVDLT